MNPRDTVIKQPGKWNGRAWICPDQPKDKIGKFFYCCPSGWQEKRRDPKIITSLTLTLKDASCSEGPDVQACGPNPGGVVKCCPRTHQWLPKNRECPMPEAARGFDPNFMNQLRLPRKQNPSEGLGKKLALIGIPMALILVGIIVMIARSG